VINRRQILLAAASVALSPRAVFANNDEASKFGWSVFQQQMQQLADESLQARLSQKAVANLGLQYLKQLDIDSAEFKAAVDLSYESGNRYWLWQRMIKGQNLNGGILNIDREQLVQLHDHPGAIGMVRIISGEVEVWQFDELKPNQREGTQGVAELKQFSRRTLKAGDMAVLMPDEGNIHALRCISKECRMLDFFIPPYQRSKRHWFEPLAENWFDEKVIACKKIPQQNFSDA